MSRIHTGTSVQSGDFNIFSFKQIGFFQWLQAEEENLNLANPNLYSPQIGKQPVLCLEEVPMTVPTPQNATHAQLASVLKHWIGLGHQ